MDIVITDIHKYSAHYDGREQFFNKIAKLISCKFTSDDGYHHCKFTLHDDIPVFVGGMKYKEIDQINNPEYYL